MSARHPVEKIQGIEVRADLSSRGCFTLGGCRDLSFAEVENVIDRIPFTAIRVTT